MVYALRSQLGATNLKLLVMLALFAGVLVLVAGCGFAPVANSATRSQLAQIKVASIAEREGQALNSALRRHLNPNGLKIGPAYLLTIELDTNLINNFTVDRNIVRRRATMTADGVLTTFAGEELWSGTVEKTSFLAQSRLPTLNEQAQDDLWVDMADLIARDMTLELGHVLDRRNQVISVP